MSSQARRQEMKWGDVKKWTFPPQNETKLTLDLFFFILHFTHLGAGGAYVPNAPPLSVWAWSRILVATDLTCASAAERRAVPLRFVGASERYVGGEAT